MSLNFIFVYQDVFICNIFFIDIDSVYTI